MADTPTTSGKGFLIGALLLVLGLGAFGAYQVYSVWKSTPQTAVRAEAPPEWLIHLCETPSASFPSTIAWGPLHRLAEDLPSPPGFEIRYTATRVLAHRGSAKVPLDNLREMIDEDRQMKNFRVLLKDGRVVPDQAEAWEVVLIGIKAIAEWHKHADAVKSVAPEELRKLYQALEDLKRSRSQTVGAQATNLLLSLKQK